MSLGLYLSGGGIKGVAHVGALKAIEEENIKFDYFVGVSSGSIVALLYSIGYKSDDIYKIFKEYAKEIKYFEWKNIFKLIYGLIFKRKIIISGLNSGKKIEKLINKYAKIKNIENINEIQRKIYIPSVDTYSGKVILFTSEKDKRNFLDVIEKCNNFNIGKVVKASCSYPRDI